MLSKDEGMFMYPGGDISKPVKLTRRNNTLGMEVYRFGRKSQAIEYARSRNANEEDSSMGSENFNRTPCKALVQRMAAEMLAIMFQ